MHPFPSHPHPHSHPHPIPKQAPGLLCTTWPCSCQPSRSCCPCFGALTVPLSSVLLKPGALAVQHSSCLLPSRSHRRACAATPLTSILRGDASCHNSVSVQILLGQQLPWHAVCRAGGKEELEMPGGIRTAFPKATLLHHNAPRREVWVLALKPPQGATKFLFEWL